MQKMFRNPEHFLYLPEWRSHMSIQKKELIKNGKTVTYYYPVVSTYKIDKNKAPIWGTGFLRKSDAQKEEARMKMMVDELVRKRDLKLSKTDFHTIRMKWEETRVTKEPVTAERDKTYCDLYLASFDDFDIKQINAEMVQKWVNLMAKKYAPKTTNLAFTLLSQILNYAVEPLHLLTVNPCTQNIQRPKIRKKGIESNQYWSKEELQYFMNHPLTQKDYYYVMYLMHSTFGMRPGELCGISLYDINLSEQLLTLNYGLDKKNRLTNLKTSGSQRTLHIPDSLIPYIQDQMKRSNLLRPKDSAYPFLFILPSGASINPDTYCQHLQRLIKKINRSSETILLKPITPYGFRHTFATLSLINGEYIKAVADAMGDSVETVTQNYIHTVHQMTDQTLQSMANVVLSSKS